MSMVSFGFIGFLLLTCVLYYSLPGKNQWIFLLLASSLFYLTGGVKTAGFICVTVLTVWISAKHVQESRVWFFLCLFVNFGILAFFKFQVTSGGGILLPLGISYYTFQSAGYLIDVRKRKYPPEKSLPRFALFISFFPQLALGPISRYDQLKKELFTPHKRDAETIGSGAQRILWGCFKKLIVANRLSGAVAAVGQDPERFGGIYVLVGMLFYTAELYADFTGGADIAIGSAELFGIRLPENFKTPFFSQKLSKYWTSWHITLMNWFREYIFYPAAVCRPVRSLSRKIRNRFGKRAGDRVSLWSASILVWLITGIWHGFRLRCVLWGLLNCMVLLLSHELEPAYAAFHNHFHTDGNKGYAVFCAVRTLLLVSCLQMFDYYKTAGLPFRMLRNMLATSDISQLFDGRMAALHMTVPDGILVFLGCLLMLRVSLSGKKEDLRSRLAKKPFVLRCALFSAALLIVIVFGAYGTGYDAGQFIYNQV